METIVRARIPGVDDSVADSLLRSTRTLVATRHECIFTEGEASGSVYLVTAGRVKISRTTNGDERILAVLGPGHVVGALSLFAGGPHSASAHALTDATLEELTHERLTQLLQERPDITLWMLQHLARRLRQANNVVTDLVLSDVPARVAQILIHLAQEFGLDVADGIKVDHGLTQMELAQLAGAARESVNKALARFAQRNWVTLASRSIIIHDLGALQQRAR